MHLMKTQEGSQFYRFHDDSSVAKECLTDGVPKINGDKVEVLQIAYVNSGKYNVIIEFVYV